MNRQQRRTLENYPSGVSDEPSPFWDFQKRPWDYAKTMFTQMMVAWHIVKNLQLDKKPVHVSILDAACGYGELRRLLGSYRKAKGCRVQYIGIDLDKDKQKVALQKQPNIDYRIKNVCEILDFVSTPFDAVASGETLEHLHKREGQQFLFDIPKILKPDGLLVLTTPTPLHSTHRKNKWHLHEWEPEMVIETLLSTGMEIVDWFFLRVPSRAWPMHTKRVPSALAMVMMSALTERVPGTSLFVVAKKGEKDV